MLQRRGNTCLWTEVDYGAQLCEAQGSRGKVTSWQGVARSTEQAAHKSTQSTQHADADMQSSAHCAAYSYTAGSMWKRRARIN